MGGGSSQREWGMRLGLSRRSSVFVRGEGEERDDRSPLCLFYGEIKEKRGLEVKGFWERGGVHNLQGSEDDSRILRF